MPVGHTFIPLIWMLLAAALGAAGCAVGNGSVPTAPSATMPERSQPRRSEAAAKLDSRLLQALERVAAGDAPDSERNRLTLDANGRVLVDLTAVVTPALLREIEVVGGLVVNQFAQYEAIRAWLRFDRLLGLAERADVTFIRPAEQPITDRATAGTASGPLDVPQTRSPLAADDLPVEAWRQIEAVVAEKAQRSPIQRKVSSHLLYANKMQRGEPNRWPKA